MGISGGGGSKTTAKPEWMPGQKEGYSGIMNMMSAYMGLPATSYAAPAAKRSPWDMFGGGGNRWRGGMMGGPPGGGDGGGGFNQWRDRNNSYAANVPAPAPMATQGAEGDMGQDYLSRLLAPYGGDLSAALTDMQKKSLETIGAYEPGELYGAGKQNILDTLSGKYNPIDSPFYKSMREKMLSEGEEAVTGARQQGNLYGQLSSTGMAGVESKARGRTATDINTILGSMFESERARQTGILPTAMQYEQYPLSVAQQKFAAGEGERGIAQQDRDRQYQEFIRQLQALGIPLEVMMNLITMPASTDQQSRTSPSWKVGF